VAATGARHDRVDVATGDVEVAARGLLRGQGCVVGPVGLAVAASAAAGVGAVRRLNPTGPPACPMHRLQSRQERRSILNLAHEGAGLHAEVRTHLAKKTAVATKSNKLPAETASLRKQVLSALDELKAKDVREIDVRGKTSITDLLLIASGTSTRHVKSIADEVVKFAKRAGVLPLGVEGEREAEWVLVDLGDIVVHVMLPRIREFYGLERLWTVGDDMPRASEAVAG
jgi:ribosome-associated protein